VRFRVCGPSVRKVGVTPPSDKTGCKPRSCQRNLDEARIHKYTHRNHKLNALNIEYYNFDSSFYTTEFCSGTDTHRCGSDTLNGTHVTPCPKMPPSTAVNAYGGSQHGSNRRVWITHW
jgi:hypothetical protein